ncbi:MAG: BatD family protein [Gammaproteobacteria bacterium]|nr:BatD family protein [Gammaproteobacteria bacterium]
MLLGRPIRSGAAIAAVALFLASIAQVADAAVQARVDPPVVDEMETVRLTLRIDGSNQSEGLDLSALEGDFEVLGTNTSSQFQSINGQVQSWVEYQVSLRPKRAGTLEIPALSIAGQTSAPLSVRVRPLAPEVRQTIDRMVFFEVEVSPNPVYVQAQALITRRLYYASGVQIYSDLPGVPDIPNAVVIPVGETRSTTEVRPEGRYGVLEQRYAIFPEQSGSLVIPEISVTSSVRLTSSGRTRRSGIRVSTPEIRLDVLPVPASYPADQPWLPARQVSVSDTWEPDSLSFDLGEPVRRTLTVNVAGNTGSSIPPLALDLPGDAFKQYPEPVSIGEETVASDVVGTREQAYSIVPVAPGALQLPQLSLTWWDTVNERVRVASAPGEQVRILGDPIAAPNPAATTGTSEAGPARPTVQPAAAAAELPTPYPAWLIGLTAFAFCGWAATWLVMRRRPASSVVQRPDPRGDASWKALLTACRTGDAKVMRDAWIRHLGIRWNAAPDRTVAMIRRHPEGRRLLDALNRALYASATSEPPAGQDIIEVTRSLLESAGERPAQPLPELYTH